VGGGAGTDWADFVLLLLLLWLPFSPPIACCTNRYGNGKVPEGDDRSISNLLLE
jgi:hypothetical protein